MFPTPLEGDSSCKHNLGIKCLVVDSHGEEAVINCVYWNYEFARIGAPNPYGGVGASRCFNCGHFAKKESEMK